jgi:hypothetical protein
LFRGCRYGHDTSNIAESLNQVLRFDQELPVVEMLDNLWHRVMEKRARRLQAASKALAQGLSATPWVEGKVEEARTWALANTVQVSSPIEGRVVQPNGSIHLVNTAARVCSCRRYQENGIPCGHAMTLIFAIGDAIAPYLPEELSVGRWVATYATPLPPVDVSVLAVLEDEVCEPPMTRIPRGRPKKERVRREDVRRPRGRRLRRDHGGLLPLGAIVAAVPDFVRSRCSTCGEPGHNARRCRRPHQ